MSKSKTKKTPGEFLTEFLTRDAECKILLVNLWDSHHAGLISRETLSSSIKEVCAALEKESLKFRGKPSPTVCLAATSKALANNLFSDRNPQQNALSAYTVTTLDIISEKHLEDKDAEQKLLVPSTGIPNDTDAEMAKKKAGYVKEIAGRSLANPAGLKIKTGASLRSALPVFWASTESLATDPSLAFTEGGKKARDWFGLIHRKSKDFLCRYEISPGNVSLIRPSQLEGGGKRFAVREHPTDKGSGQAVDLDALEKPTASISRIQGGQEMVCREKPLTHKEVATLAPLGYPGNTDRDDSAGADEDYLKALLDGRDFDKDLLPKIMLCCPP